MKTSAFCHNAAALDFNERTPWFLSYKPLRTFGPYVKLGQLPGTISQEATVPIFCPYAWFPPIGCVKKARLMASFFRFARRRFDFRLQHVLCVSSRVFLVLLPVLRLELFENVAHGAHRNDFRCDEHEKYRIEEHEKDNHAEKAQVAQDPH